MRERGFGGSGRFRRRGNKVGEVVAGEVEVAEAGEEGEGVGRVPMRRFWERSRWKRGVQKDIWRGRFWLLELLKRMMEWGWGGDRGRWRRYSPLISFPWFKVFSYFLSPLFPFMGTWNPEMFNTLTCFVFYYLMLLSSIATYMPWIWWDKITPQSFFFLLYLLLGLLLYQEADRS